MVEVREQRRREGVHQVCKERGDLRHGTSPSWKFKASLQSVKDPQASMQQESWDAGVGGRKDAMTSGGRFSGDKDR